MTVAIVNAFDGAAVEQALRRSQAEVVIDQLTALPKDPAGYAAAFPGDRKLRLEREMPVIGQGEGVWSFVHIDAALASVAALAAPPGIYNVVMTILLQSAAGCQRLRDGLELHPLPS